MGSLILGALHIHYDSRSQVPTSCRNIRSGRVVQGFRKKVAYELRLEG
jgi:hypothetical protein